MAVRKMPATDQIVDVPTRNRILAALPPAEMERISKDLEPYPLLVQSVLYEADKTITHAYFPTSGCVSMVNSMEDGSVEVGTIGFEGYAGIPLFLQDNQMPTRAFVQLEGASFRMTADAFKNALVENPTFSRILARHTLAIFNQVSQSVACNRLHTLESRCARWLLMTHDRMNLEQFVLTHEFLSYMLGVHRPAVTLAAGVLQRAGLIRYSRGKVTVLDRPGLEAVSCACYESTRRNYARLAAN